MKKIKTILVLILSLIFVFGGAFLGYAVNTAFFKYDVYAQTIETKPATSKGDKLADDNGGKASKSTADIYKPKVASADNKVPLIFVVPGIQRTKETQASFCIELARRGYGVICVDPFAQGESTSSYESQSATQEGYGLFAWMDNLFKSDKYTLKEEWSWVDASRIGACGHSAGGNACQKFAEREGKIAAQNNKPSRVNGVYITGYIRGWSWSTSACNIGISYSANDEGAFQNKTKLKKNEIEAKKAEGKTLTAEEQWWLTVGNADLRYAEESVAIVNFQLNRALQLWKANNPGKPYTGMASLPKTEVAEGVSVSAVTIGEQYGNPFEYTYCIINNESSLHALMPYDSEMLANLINFFGYTMEVESPITDTNQLWWLKELSGVISLVGAFMFICVLGSVLLRTKAFASLKKERPERQGDQKIRGRVVFWITFALSATIACLLYTVCVQWSVDWFVKAAGSMQTWFFPQRFTNAVMLWAVVNGLIGTVLFFLTWAIEFVIDIIGHAIKALIAKGKKSESAPNKGVKIALLVISIILGVAALVGGYFLTTYVAGLFPAKFVPYEEKTVGTIIFFVAIGIAVVAEGTVAIIGACKKAKAKKLAEKGEVKEEVAPATQVSEAPVAPVMKTCGWIKALYAISAILSIAIGYACTIVCAKYLPEEGMANIGKLAVLNSTIKAVLVSVSAFWTVLPLLWIMPMGTYYKNKTLAGEKVGLGFKICTLIFANVVAGILLLCGYNDKVKEVKRAKNPVVRAYASKLEPIMMNSSDIYKTLLLAGILIVAFFGLDYIIYAIFHVDMRFLFISARVTYNWHVIVATLMYLPFFFVFYFSNSLRVNSAMRPKNWPEWLSQVIAVLGNTVGLIAIIFIEYIPMVKTGTIGYTITEGPQWLFVNLLFSIVPMMALLPILNRFFFNKTGRSWLGPIVTCIIFIAMTTGATTLYTII